MLPLLAAVLLTQAPALPQPSPFPPGQAQTVNIVSWSGNELPKFCQRSEQLPLSDDDLIKLAKEGFDAAEIGEVIEQRPWACDAAADGQRATAGGESYTYTPAQGGAGVDDNGVPPDGKGGAGGNGSASTKLQGSLGRGRVQDEFIRAGGGGGGGAGRIVLRANKVTYGDAAVLSPRDSTSAVRQETPTYFTP